MPIAASSPLPARRATEPGRRALLLSAGLSAGMVLAGCATPSAPPVAGPVIPTREALPLDEATVALAEAALAPTRASASPRVLVIDPLIDRATGAETSATRRMETVIGGLVRDRYPGLELRPFSVAALDAQPLILLGAITRVEAPGSLVAAKAPSGTYRIWAVLADLRTGRVVVHPTLWVQGASVDATPTAFYRDSPAWTDDEMLAAYLRTCAGNAGAPIDPAYLRGLRAQALVADAVRAYEAGEMARANMLYAEAAAAPGGPQARALNGLYLTDWALGRREAATEAFGQLVAYGLDRKRLAVRLLFRPGGTEFVRDPGVSAPYPMWLGQIAAQAAARPDACLLVEGHASVTGSAALNDRLSLARAEAVRGRLLRNAPSLGPRSAAAGRGSRQPIVGLGTDDMRDALDRRVEFRPDGCGLSAA